jgi:hypothetical protein
VGLTSLFGAGGAVSFCIIARRLNAALADQTESLAIARMLGRQHRAMFAPALPTQGVAASFGVRDHPKPSICASNRARAYSAPSSGAKG